MAREIERKFLVVGGEWRQGAGVLYRQGYLSTETASSVRVRRGGERAYLTIKGEMVGTTRPEYEYKIPTGDADELLERFCKRPLIEKWRYRIEHEGFIWEVDEFLNENDGLVVAEVELEHEGQPIERPEWVGLEVTDDPRYLNANLVRHPYREWA